MNSPSPFKSPRLHPSEDGEPEESFETSKTLERDEFVLSNYHALTHQISEKNTVGATSWGFGDH